MASTRTISRSRRNAAAFFVPLALVFLAGVAAFLRFSIIWPEAVGLSWYPYEDEGVYALAGQLVLQGFLPYRDFFFAHPPLAAFVFSPALLYHFNEWGSPTSFMMARYFSAFLGVVCVFLVYGIGWKVSGWKIGLGAAAVWALDGLVITANRQVMLETPLMVFVLAAVLAGFVAAQANRWPLWWAGAAGLLSALAGLTKMPGVLIVLVVLAALLLVRRRKAAVVAGSVFVGIELAVTLLFHVLSGGEYLRQVFWFQMARPSDGIPDVLGRLFDPIVSGQSVVTAVAAVAGIVALLIMWRRRNWQAWGPVLLWLALMLALILTSRSYYAHYFVLLAAPLAVIGGGVTGLADYLGRRDPRYVAAGAVVMLVSIFGVLTIRQVIEIQAPHDDRIYVMVGRYLADTPPGSKVLAMDSGFAMLSAKEPARGPDGTFLVDSYGQLIYVGLKSSKNGGAEKRVLDVMHRSEAQSNLLGRIENADYFVVDAKSAGRITPETMKQIESRSDLVEKQERYGIYRLHGGK